MNAKQRRQYEMLLRARDFGSTHGHLFPASPAAQRTFAALGAAIDELSGSAVRKMSASALARAERKVAARQALSEVMLRVSQLARVLRADGRTTPVFEFPESRSDQALLTAARQFARDANELGADFTSHGMPPARIAGMVTAFEDALAARRTSRADYTAARARIEQLLGTALLDVRRLDVIVANELGRDDVIQAVWRQARQIERRPRRVARTDATAAPASTLPFEAGGAPPASAGHEREERGVVPLAPGRYRWWRHYGT